MTHRKKVSVSFDIIGKNKPEYSMIQSAGTSSLTDKQLKEMCEKYL